MLFRSRQVGFLRRLLQAFEDLDLSVEHVPTGIDDASIVLRSSQFENNNKLEELQEIIRQDLDPEWIHIEENSAIIAIVGEGMRNTIGIANKATEGFTKSGVSLRMINQGASEISMFFSIPAKDLNKSIRFIYDEYFN